MQEPEKHTRYAADEADSAERIAYTINHALACTFTDFIDPWVGHKTQQYLGRRYSIGCGHDHSHDHHGHHHHDHDHHHHHAPASRFSHWALGEVAGDFGAVPVTLACARFAPGLMEGIGKLMEPVAMPLFRAGASLSSGQWAKRNGFAADSPERKAQQENLYRHEMSYLPQALIWTASSVGINLGVQRMLGNRAPLWQMAAGKISGAAISAGAVVGGRAAMPETARSWDRFTSKNIFLPATKAAGRLFGIDSDTVERMEARKEEGAHHHGWAEKVSQLADVPRNGAIGR